ncbi:hypothetical protein [Microbacterium sp. ProA8]|uniref:hypothetical protein n=1 Tax=Microbacterium chionoecetis TaxID=3153754 RepID=UPI00326719AF
MSTPTEPPLDELRALRERAYGRHADIQDDPDALARLRELEAQASSATTSTPAESAAPAAVGGIAPGGIGGDGSGRLPDGDRTTDAAALRSGITPVDGAQGSSRAVEAGQSLGSRATAADGGESSVAATIPPGAPGDPSPAEDGVLAEQNTAPRSPWWRRRTPLLWVASVVAGVLVGVGLTLAVQAAGEGRVATLNEDADAEWPEQFFGARPADAAVFDDFHGLTVLTFRQPAQPGSPQSCLYILTPPDGFGAGTCAADAFPPTASLEVGPASPDELRDRYPRGTALQFVLEGSSVQVYAREPSLVEPTP